MSLKTFHIVFVSLSSLLAFSFGGWNLHGYRSGAGTGMLLAGIGSVVGGLALIVYGFWFWRKITTREEEDRRRRKTMRALAIIAGVWLLASRDASACNVCYGAADGPLIDAARMGVYLLFGLVLLVQACFASFFICLWKRARKQNPGLVPHWRDR